MCISRLAGTQYNLADFWTAGLWLWTGGGGWTQLNGLRAAPVMTADTDGDGDDEVVSDFTELGPWLWNDAVWAKIYWDPETRTTRRSSRARPPTSRPRSSRSAPRPTRRLVENLLN